MQQILDFHKRLPEDLQPTSICRPFIDEDSSAAAIPKAEKNAETHFKQKSLPRNSELSRLKDEE